MSELSGKSQKLTFEITVTPVISEPKRSLFGGPNLQAIRDAKSTFPFVSVGTMIPKELHKKISYVLIDEELTWTELIESLLTSWLETPRKGNREQT